MKINHTEMVMTLSKPGEDILTGLTPTSVHNLHMAVGIAGECSELFDAFRPARVDRGNVKEECGDIEFYVKGLAVPLSLERWNGAYEPISIHEALSRLVVAGGAVLDVVKRESIYGQKLNMEKLTSAIREVDIATCVLARSQGYSRKDYEDANIEKLGDRYKNFTYTDAAAEARADKDGES